MSEHNYRQVVWRTLNLFTLLLSLLYSPLIWAQSNAEIYLPLVITNNADTGASALRSASAEALPQPTIGIWVNATELAARPASGPAWDFLQATADQPAEMPDLSDQNSNANVQVLAKALVYVRTGQTGYRNEVLNALQIITQNNTEAGGRTLALGRELVAYIIAADLIDLGSLDPTLDTQFRTKLRELLTASLDGLTLQSTHETRANNWGTHAGAARAAAAIYLGDSAELARTATVFHGWLGNRSLYSSFSYGDLSWQANPNSPVGVNPLGSVKEGHNIDGALPEEMRRGGSFQWPPRQTGYAWEGLQGALVQAELLHRAGYPAWEWEDQALLRAVQFLYGIGWSATGDDEWQVWLINHAYGTNYPAAVTARPGKNMGWTSWTHSSVTLINQPPTVGAGDDQTITLPSSATLVGTAGDDGLPAPPELSIAWSQQSGPGNVTFGDAGSLNSSASFSQAGTYLLRLTVHDGEFSAFDELTITVNDAPTANQPPTVSAGDDQTITLPNSATLAGTAGDDGLPAPPELSIAWSQQSGPGNVTFGDASSLNSSASFSQAGTYLLRLTAHDGELSAFDELTVTVNDAPTANQPPTVSAGDDQTITLPSSATLAGTAGDDGLPAPPELTSTWSQQSGPGNVTFGDAASLNSSASFSQAGTYLLRLTVHDGELSAFDELTITVNDAPTANQPPTVSAGDDQTITLPSSATLAGTAGDDGLPAPPELSIAWSQQSGPGNVTFGDASSLNSSASFSQAGTYLLRLTVHDGELSAFDELTITVNDAPTANQPPTVSAGDDQTITLPSSATLAGTAGDDGLPAPPELTSTWSQQSGPGNVTFGDAGSLNTSASFSQAGTYLLRLTVHDGELSAFDELTVTVNDAPTANQPPTVSAGDDQTITLPSSATLVGTAGDDSLPAPPALTTSWSQQSGPGDVTFGDAGSLNSSASFSQAGTYLLRLTAHDGELSTFDELTITVNDADQGGSGTANFQPVGDAVVKSSSPTRNYGSESYLRLRSNSSPYYNSYLQFNVTNISGAVQSAKLRLYVTDASDVGGSIYLVSNIGSDGAPWTESGITWNNAPPMGSSPLAVMGAVNSGEWVEYNVTAAISGDGLYAFGLETTSGNSVLFSSKEGANAPELVVTYGSGAGGEPANQPPAVSAGDDQSITLPNAATLSGTAGDDGLPNPPGALTTSWSQQSGPGNVTFGDAGSLNSSASFSQAGTYLLRLTAHDGELSAFDELTVTVNDPLPGNQPPTVSAGDDQTITLPSSATLVGTADDDGLPAPPALTTSWSQQSGPGNVTFGDAGSLNSSASFSQAGTYLLRLTAHDGELSTSSDVTILVNEAGSGGNSDEYTFVAVADAMVKSSSPTRNYGNVGTIRLRDSDPFYTSYIQFNVTGLLNPVQSARLRLFVTDASNRGGSVHAVSNNGNNGVPWTESQITWENAPAISGSPLYTLGAVGSDLWVEFDVTNALSEDGLYSFGLNTDSSNSVLYSSKEGAHPPQLIVNTGVTAAQISDHNSLYSRPSIPSIDASEGLLDARLIQELNRLAGGVSVYLPVAEK